VVVNLQQQCVSRLEALSKHLVAEFDHAHLQQHDAVLKAAVVRKATRQAPSRSESPQSGHRSILGEILQHALCRAKLLPLCDLKAVKPCNKDQVVVSLC
jgi:hypothetical protein